MFSRLLTHTELFARCRLGHWALWWRFVLIEHACMCARVVIMTISPTNPEWYGCLHAYRHSRAERISSPFRRSRYGFVVFLRMITLADCCCLRVRDAQDTMTYRTKNIFLTKEQLASNASQYEAKSTMLRSEKDLEVRHVNASDPQTHPHAHRGVLTHLMRLRCRRMSDLGRAGDDMYIMI